MSETFKSKRAVIALGGNALGNTPGEQLEKVKQASKALCDIIGNGTQVVISHGNGPQVGIINLAFSESSERNEKIPPMPLAECTAMSEGYIGFHLECALRAELSRRGLNIPVATVVTETVVDESDPAFSFPTKPIGAFYTKEQADRFMAEDARAVFKEDAGRGYRRVVASPVPVGIVQKDAVLTLLENGFAVIAGGGGGIPVTDDGKSGEYRGADAVVDKDLASEKLAELTDADTLVILTAVERVCLDFGKPTEREIAEMTVSDAEKYISEGHFAKGSMLPKVEAAAKFARSAVGRRAIIASLENASEALGGTAGTVITMG